jgi:general secretion pathway protein J
MKSRIAGACGFTLIELLTALLILSLLALMSYRGLAAVIDARTHVTEETEKWRNIAAFFVRFERDVQLAAPRPARSLYGMALPWRGRSAADAVAEPLVEFSRFASGSGVDAPRRLGYRLNERQQIELWLWPGLDIAPDMPPARYPVLAGVTQFELRYLTTDLVWVDTWPASGFNPAIPQAVQLRIVLASGEEIVRVFALTS